MIFEDFKSGANLYENNRIRKHM